MKIEITKMRLLTIENPKAIVSVLVDGSIVIHDIRVIQRPSGKLFVAMPRKPDNYGKYHDVVHPILPELREHIDSVILAEYKRQSLSDSAH